MSEQRRETGHTPDESSSGDEHSSDEPVPNQHRKNLEVFLKELAGRSTQAVASPGTIEHLRAQGLPIKDLPHLTPEEYIDLLFSRRKEGALNLVKRLPGQPPPAIPFIASLYKEISECIIFGLNGAAITLSGVLVEFALKYATYIHEVGGFGYYDSTAWDRVVESKTLAPAIDAALRAGLVDEDLAEKLRSFKDEIRNPYNHYNVRKITKGVVFGNVQIIDMETGEVDQQDIAAKDNPVFQARAKPHVDARHVFEVFHCADHVVKHLLDKLPS